MTQEGAVRFAKLFLRGLKDVYDQFVLLMIVSVLWWVCAITIVLAPPATVALFRMADPRNAVEMPELRDFFRTIREVFRTAWGVAALTVPVILILLWNATFFQNASSSFAVMVPLWIVMAAIALMVMVYALAMVATMESGVRNAFRGATYLIVMRPFTSGLMIVALALFSVVLGVLVLPLVLFGPATVAAVVNRFALAGLGIEVIDPNAPTTERASERQRGVGPDEGVKGFFGSLRGQSRDGRK